MSVSEYQVPSDDKAGRKTPREAARQDKWSPRLTLLTVVLSSLVLWCGIFLVVSWIF